MFKTKDWLLKATKDRPYRGWFWNETYNQGCYVLFPTTKEQFKREYTNWNREAGSYKDSTFNVHGAKFISYDGKHAIAFPVKRPKPEIIAHEALHWANFVLDGAGVHFEYDNDEPQAYLMQFAINKICKMIRDAK